MPNADWFRNWTADQKRELRKHLRRRDGDRCYLCGGRMLFQYKYANHPDFRSFDHLLSPKKGGAIFDPKNIRLAHRHCNSSRQNGHADSK